MKNRVATAVQKIDGLLFETIFFFTTSSKFISFVCITFRQYPLMVNLALAASKVQFVL